MSDDNRQCCCSKGRDGGCENQNKSQCGKSGGCSGGCQNRVIFITEAEREFLMKLSQIPFLPLARFIMKSSKSDHMESVALEPVYLQDRNDSMDAVKNTGAVLRSLEDKYMITLDYDLPLQNGDYSIYEESDIYRSFCSVVQEGGKQNGFLFDLPVLERGSIALTTLGQDAIDSLE